MPVPHGTNPETINEERNIQCGNYNPEYVERAREVFKSMTEELNGKECGDFINILTNLLRKHFAKLKEDANNQLEFINHQINDFEDSLLGSKK